MSVNEGNAWALRRAKEREQMRLSGDTEQGSLSSMKSGMCASFLHPILQGKERDKERTKLTKRNS